MNFWSFIMDIFKLATLPESVMSLRRTLHCLCTESLNFFLFSSKLIFPPVYFFFIMTWLHQFSITSERFSTIALLIVYKNVILLNSLYILPIESWAQWHHRFWQSCQPNEVHNKDLIKLQKSIKTINQKQRIQIREVTLGDGIGKRDCCGCRTRLN